MKTVKEYFYKSNPVLSIYEDADRVLTIGISKARHIIENNDMSFFTPLQEEYAKQFIYYIRKFYFKHNKIKFKDKFYGGPKKRGLDPKCVAQNKPTIVEVRKYKYCGKNCTQVLRQRS